MSLKVTIDKKKKEMTIVIPINDPPTPSNSGKTLIVATTSGNAVISDVEINGKPLTLGLNAYIKK